MDQYERTTEKVNEQLFICTKCNLEFKYPALTSGRKRCKLCNGIVYPKIPYTIKKTVSKITQNKLVGYETGPIMWDEQFNELHNAFVAAATGAENLAKRRPREMAHELKIEKKYYDRILSGEKTFEVRYNDRDYQTGDLIRLNMIPKNGEKPCNKPILKEIAYIHSGLGMETNYIIIGLKEIGL